LFQIENEFGPQGKLQGAAGQNYVNWAAKMAVEMGTAISVTSLFFLAFSCSIMEEPISDEQLEALL
jgi:hypothetical protein